MPQSVQSGRISAVALIWIGMFFLLVLAIVLSFADIQRNPSAWMSNIADKVLQALSLGITFALVVLAYSAFKLQQELEGIRTEVAREISQMRDRRIQMDRVYNITPIMLATLNQIATELRPVDPGVAEPMDPDERKQIYDEQTASLHCERLALSVVMTDSIKKKVDSCRDIIGIMENRPAASDREVISLVIEVLQEIAATNAGGLSGTDLDEHRVTKREAAGLLHYAWQIEERFGAKSDIF